MSLADIYEMFWIGINTKQSIEGSSSRLFGAILILILQFGPHDLLSQDPVINKISSGDSLFALGDSSYFSYAYEKAILHYRQALGLYETAKDSVKVSNTLNDIGISYRRLGTFDSALWYYEKALDLDVLMLDSARIIGRYRNMSSLYVDRGNYTRASRLLLDAREIALKTGYTNSLGGVNNALGSLYENQEEYDKAITYYHQAKKVYLRADNQAKYGIALNNLGKSYSEMQRWDSAFYYLREALQVKREHATANSLAYTVHDLGSVFLSRSELDSAEHYLQRAYQMREQLSDRLGLAQTANELGSLYLQQSNLDEAYSYIMQAREYAKDESTQKILLDNTRTLRDYYLAAGDTVKAFQTNNSWTALRDSVLNKAKVKVLEQESAYKLSLKEAARKQEETKAINQRRIAEKRLIILVVVTGATILLIVLVLVVIRQRTSIKKLSENLKLVNRDMYHRKKNDYMRLLNEISASNVVVSDDIRGQLLASAAVDESLYEDESDMVELSQYLEEKLEDVVDAQGFKTHQVNLETKLERVQISGQRASAIFLVINELITNSLKHSFADRGGVVHLSAVYEKGTLSVTYKDDGAPFPAKMKNKGMGQAIISNVLKPLKAKLNREVRDSWNLSTFKIKLS